MSAFRKKPCLSPPVDSKGAKHQPLEAPPPPRLPETGSTPGALFTCVRRFPGDPSSTSESPQVLRVLFLAAEESPTTEGLQTKRFWSLLGEVGWVSMFSGRLWGAYTFRFAEENRGASVHIARWLRPERSATAGRGGLWRVSA